MRQGKSDLFSTENIQLLSWPVYSPDMPAIEQVWDFIGQCLACYPRLTTLIDEFWVCLQEIWNVLPHPYN